MQQDNTDKILKRMENQQLPDLSQMDKHWQDMQHILAIAPRPKANGSRRVVRIAIGAAAATLIGITAYFIGNKGLLSSHEKTQQVAKANPIKKASPIIISTNTNLQPASTTIIKQSTLEKPLRDDRNNSIARKNIASPKTDLSIADVADNNVTSAIRIVPDSSTTKRSAIKEDKAVLSMQQFWQQLEKTPEIFAVNNSKDTMISASEGTVVFIPAGCFNTNKPIKFQVKEFYQYGDMVANGLTTTSGKEQLISGGMMYMSAEVDGKETNLNKGSSVRVFIPGLQPKDSMLIFTGEKSKIDFYSNPGQSSARGINWQLSKISIDSPVSKMFIRALDLKDDDIEEVVKTNGKVKAIFQRSRNSELSKGELETMLKKKYADYYDIVKVHRLWQRNLLFKKIESTDEEYYGVYNAHGVGDTDVLRPRTVEIYKLKPIDTLFKVVNWIHLGSTDVRRYAISRKDLATIGEKYSIEIDKLGWVNCDRFYGVPLSQRTDFTIDLNDSAMNYESFMIFDKYKSIYPGGGFGQKVYFSNVPLGQPVKLLCVGYRDGMLQYAMKETTTSNKTLSGFEFRPADPSMVKGFLNRLNK